MDSPDRHAVGNPAGLPKLTGLKRRLNPVARPQHDGNKDQSQSQADGLPTCFLVHGTCQFCGKVPGADALLQIGGKTICAACKPLAIQRIEEGGQLQNVYAEQFRRPYLHHERRIVLLGALCLTWGVLLTWAFPVLTAAGGMLAVVPGPLMCVAGVGLSGLKSWSRRAYVIFAMAMIPSFPLLAIAVQPPILYFLYSKQSSVAFSHAYREVIYATPHVRHAGPLPTWVFVIASCLAFLGLMALLNSSPR